MSDTVTEPTGEWFDAMPGWGRGQRATLAVLGLLFAALVFAAPVTWCLLRPVKTSSSVPPPTWNQRTFASGDAMRQLERHLKESSWVTFELRGLFNETLLRFGALESDRVVFGRDGWMFLPATMQWTPDALTSTEAPRREVLRQARDLLRFAGIELLVVPTPDKVTVYPDKVRPGQLQAGRERLYDVILADLAAVGIPHIDVRELFRRHRDAEPDELLYHRRGTHWNFAGYRIVADAVRARIVAEGWDDRIRREPSIVLLEPRERNRVPGLVRLLGLRVEDERDHAGLSGVVRGVMETTTWRPVFLRKADGQLAYIDPVQPDATVALCGTSFSESFGPELCGALRTFVDRRCVIGGGGSFRSMRKLVEEVLKGGFLPRIVIWEFVQRDYQGEWTTAKSLLQ